jgi:hypothetical protein
MAKNKSFENLALTLSPVIFMQKAFGANPDDWQKELLTKYPDKSLLLCSRQSGKSTVSAVIALYHALVNSDALILIISKAFRQAEELFRKMKVGIAYITKKGIISIEHETQRSIQFSNGSRILSLPGRQETVRAYSKVAYLIIDEAAQVPDELYKTVRPMLAVSKGKIIAMTTPYGKRGWFHNSWENGKGWYKVKVTAEDCPRITQEFLDEEMLEIGEWWVKQEYYCEFVDNKEQVFNYEDIEAAICENLYPLN